MKLFDAVPNDLFSVLASPKHLFRKKENHVPDTSENRELLLRVCNDERNYMGTDMHGNRWYVQILPDGRQVWVTTRDGIIQNCGINEAVRSWDNETGLSQPRRKGVEKNMENTPRGKAFMAMYYLLDSIYSKMPYHNLAVVLGDICPFTFTDRMPADPAAWDDFCEYYKEAEGAYSGEIEVGYYTALRFLRVYEEEWDFPIPYAMEEFTMDKYREYFYKQDV